MECREFDGRGEECVAVAQREGLPDRRPAGVHDDRPGVAIGLGIGAHALAVEKPAREIEIAVLGPGPLDDVEPLLRVVITVVVLALRDAEHLELTLVPADHEVDAEAALADVVGGDELLGGDQGMKQRRVHRAEHGDALGGGQEAAGPGHGFERRAVKVGVAAIALPAADRQHEVDAGLVRHARELQAIRPAGRPPLRHLGGRAARRAVGAEDADLQRVGVVHRRAVGQRSSTAQHGGHRRRERAGKLYTIRLSCGVGSPRIAAVVGGRGASEPAPKFDRLSLSFARPRQRGSPRRPRPEAEL